jgi:hypothetical protein
MLTSKQTILRSLLESENGIHLTAYLVNRGDLIDLKYQLNRIINESYEWLNSVMSTEEQKRFLGPLDSLLLDARIFKQMKGNIGLFRTRNSLRVLNIPIDVEQSCQVATSFHVKPVLRWLQEDQEFLLLGMENGLASLYLGSQDSFKLVDSIDLPEFFKEQHSFDGYVSIKESRQRKIKEDETFAWINEWIKDITETTSPKLFVAGEKSKINSLHRHLHYKNTVKTPIFNSFGQHHISDICTNIRKILKDESKKNLEKSLLEFRFAEEENRTCKNIFQISKAVAQGKVRKLVVTDELNIFGKIHKESGRLAIHPFDLDHEDDCILDDLAQMVLGQGGEVVIANRDEIPKGRPILAILDNEAEALEKREDFYAFEVLKERFI